MLLFCLLCSLQVPLGAARSCTKQSDCGGSDVKYKPCIDDECAYCEGDEECTNNSDDVCNDDDGFCSIPDFLDPFTVTDLLASLIICIGAMIAAGGGLGGGGIFIPVYILVLGMSTASAAALSQATIFGGSIVNLIMNFRVKHPLRKHRPLPDLYTILIFEPMLLGGTIIGVIFNVILPEPITLSCLVVTLSYAAYRTLRKGVRLWKKESALILTESYRASEQDDKAAKGGAAANGTDLRAAASSNENRAKASGLADNDELETNDDDLTANNSSANSTPQTGTSTPKGRAAASPASGSGSGSPSRDPTEDPTASSENSERFLVEACGVDSEKVSRPSMMKDLKALIPLINDEKRVRRPLLIMLAMWSVVSAFAIGRRGVEGCGAAYWVLTACVFPFLVLLAFALSRRQVRSYQFKLEYGWVPCEGDIEWLNFRQAIAYSLIAGLAGLLGGLLGIGGGMIVSPLLLELGVLPRVASATSAMAVLVTSSSATLQFLLIDMLAVDYMFFFMSIGIAGTFVGQTIVNHCIRRYGRTSVVVLAIGTVIALAVLLMGLKGIVDIANGDSHLIFSSLC